MAKKPTKAEATPAPAAVGYYDAMIAKWPTLQPGTTDQKLHEINSLQQTGAIPTSIYISGPQLVNCVNFPEFKILTAQQQNNLLALFQTTDQALLLGGSGNTTLLTVGLILDCFPTNGPTIANLTALAKATTTTWCFANGYPNLQGSNTYGGLTQTDCINAWLV